MRRLLFLAVMAATGGLFGCGGGGKVTPPPPTGGFSNASLKGQYTFSMSGEDLSGAMIARAGSFIADGNGNITGGLEDVVDLGSGAGSFQVSFTGGSYQIQANGRGIVALQSANGGLQLHMALTSVNQGFLAQTDLNATSSGSFNLATPADFAAGSLNGNYVFDFSGVSFASNGNVAPISTIGKIVADGAGTVTGGVIDVNDGNASAPSGAIVLQPGTFQLDPSGNGTAFGRGTLSFNGHSYAFYIVDHTRIKVAEEDTLGGSLGDAVLQSGSMPTQNAAFTGGFVHLLGGASVVATGSQGPIAEVARFTADGNGGVGSLSFDQNNDGGYLHIAQGSNISKATYEVDTANAGSGRGTFTYTDSSAGTYIYVFYLASPTQGVLQETSAGVIADGTFLAQMSGPFSVSGSAGNYAFNWSGVQLGSQNAIPFEEDFVGQYALSSSSSNNIAGVVDYVELGLSNKQLFSNVGISGVLTVSGDGTNNNKYQIVLGGSPSTTVNFQAYFATPSTVLLVCSDSVRVTAGIATGQSQ